MAPSEQRTVVVTGSSSGIGEATVTRLAQDGWIVFAGVRKEADATRLKAVHENIKPIILDVTQADSVQSAFETVRTAVGEHGLDALVNNAGVAFSGPSEFVPVSDFEKQMDVNFHGMIRVTQAAMPLLRIGKPGRVANVGSIADELNFPHASMYCASKAAVSSATDVLRREVQRWGIKVAIIKPGPVKTKFDDTALANMQAMQAKFPQGSECYKYYGPELDHLPKAMEPFQKNQAPPSKCAATIAKFLNAWWPRTKYYDTWGTYFTMCFVGLIPERLYNYLIGKIFLGK